jgi:chemotaxis-related protein WspB
MLFLLFQLGDDRYALEATHTVEVMPFVAVKRIPHAPRGVAGVFNYRGRPVPALDLCLLTIGRPARELLSTRIIVVNFADATGKIQWAGLIAEQATGMMRREASQFVDPGVTVAAAPYLGPVLTDERGVIQLLRPEYFLNDAARQLLGADAETLDHEPG